MNEEKKEEKYIKISKETYDNLTDSISQLTQRVEILTKASNKSALEKAMKSKGPTPGAKVKLSFYEGKLVLAWAMTKNDVYKDPITNAWRENQTIKLIFSDNKEKEIDYLSFVKFITKEEANVIARLKDTDGKETLKVELNGEEYIIDPNFVN